MLRYTRQAMPSVAPVHARSLLLGVILLGAVHAWVSRPVREAPKPGVDIAVEQRGGEILGLTLTTKSGAGLLELSVKHGSGTFISVPAEWRRTLVRNATLAQIVGEDAAFGFRRWTMTPRAAVTFAIEKAPGTFRILNPTTEPMEVRFTAVDLDAKTVTNRSRLFTEDSAVFP